MRCLLGFLHADCSLSVDCLRADPLPCVFPCTVPKLARSTAPFTLLASSSLFVVIPALFSAAMLRFPSGDHVFHHAHPLRYRLFPRCARRDPYCLPCLCLPCLPPTLSASAGVFNLRNTPSHTPFPPRSPSRSPASLYPRSHPASRSRCLSMIPRCLSPPGLSASNLPLHLSALSTLSSALSVYFLSFSPPSPLPLLVDVSFSLD